MVFMEREHIDGFDNKDGTQKAPCNRGKGLISKAMWATLLGSAPKRNGLKRKKLEIVESPMPD